MLSPSFRRLLAFFHRSARRPCQPAAPRGRQRLRLELESLENRLTPSIDVWTGANQPVNTNWSDGANWSLGVASGAGDIASFTNNSSVRSFTATVDQNFTIAGSTRTAPTRLPPAPSLT
jgi:hypothetical protein